MGEGDQGMHHGELTRMVQLHPRHAFAIREDGGLAEGSQLAPIDEGLQNVLLHVLAVSTIEDSFDRRRGRWSTALGTP
jgi:hypothetical protein